MIRANAEISGLKVGAETMAFLDGAKDIELGSRPSTGTVVEATSRDGRRAKGTVTSEAHELKLVFPPIKRGGGTPKPPSGGNTTPFADNPYKKK